MSRSGNKRRGTYVAGADDSAFAEVKRRKRLRALKKRQLREQEQDIRVFQSINEDIDRIEDMNVGELAAFRSKCIKAREIALREDPNDDTSAIDEVITILDAIFETRKILLTGAEQAIRKLRIEAKQRERAAAEKPAQEVMCVVCHKRPRHFGDYCKRCVPNNERPTGKV